MVKSLFDLVGAKITPGECVESHANKNSRKYWRSKTLCQTSTFLLFYFFVCYGPAGLCFQDVLLEPSRRGRRVSAGAVHLPAIGSSAGNLRWLPAAPDNWFFCCAFGLCCSVMWTCGHCAKFLTTLPRLLGKVWILDTLGCGTRPPEVWTSSIFEHALILYPECFLFIICTPIKGCFRLYKLGVFIWVLT